MGKQIEIILTQDIKSLGKLGEQKQVKSGFARNYLVPKGLALYVNPQNLLKFESIKKKEIQRRAKEKADCKSIVTVLNGKIFDFTEKTHDEGKLYGSITPDDVISLIKEKFEITLSRKQLDMSDHIKEIGEYAVPLSLHSEVTGEIKLKIQAQPEKEK